MSGGISCRTSDNGGSCLDYKIRFFCPSATVELTGAPIEPFDSCTGVTCSAHGECMRNTTSASTGGYVCSCESGYFRRDCDDTPMRISVTHNVSECGGPALGHRLPGIQCPALETRAQNGMHPAAWSAHVHFILAILAPTYAGTEPE